MSTALLYLLVFTGGVFTILSPCILPVLPFVFSRSGRSFRRDTLPMLVGMALAFSLIATAATIGAAWVGGASDIARWVALAVLFVAGVSLIAPRVSETLARPLQRAGAQLANHGSGSAPLRALSIGVATGLLWAPCAGPILGLVFGVAIASASATRAAALFALFALGAMTSLAVALAASGRVMIVLRRRLAADVWIRRGVGSAVIAAVGLLALGLDARLFARGGLLQTASAEERLIRTLAPAGFGGDGRLRGAVPGAQPTRVPVPTPDLGPMPSIEGGTGWIGSVPLTNAGLRGSVVFVNFWTFECYNCLNALPHVKSMHAKYASQGLVVVGVHTPEFPRERVEANVRAAMQRLEVRHAVVTDNGFAIWRAFGNRYWPSAYIVDRRGRIRYHWDGEGKYEEQERVVQQLLHERMETR